MNAAAAEVSAWHSHDGKSYRTRGAFVWLHPGTGWVARVGKRVRGPISNALSAMEAADQMLIEAAKSDRGAERKAEIKEAKAALRLEHEIRSVGVKWRPRGRPAGQWQDGRRQEG